MADDQPSVPQSTPGSGEPPVQADAVSAADDAAEQTAAAPTEQPAAGSDPAAAATEPAGTADASDASDASDAANQAAIDELLRQASFEDPVTAMPAAASAAPDAASFDLPNFQQVMQEAQVSSIELLRDVDLNVKIELGRSRMLVEDVLKLAEGSVVELDKLAGDPVDVFVNDRLVARGEVLVLNDNFCVRVNEIVAGLKEEGV